jgi:hypothetical protein
MAGLRSFASARRSIEAWAWIVARPVVMPSKGRRRSLLDRSSRDHRQASNRARPVVIRCKGRFRSLLDASSSHAKAGVVRCSTGLHALQVQASDLARPIVSPAKVGVDRWTGRRSSDDGCSCNHTKALVEPCKPRRRPIASVDATLLGRASYGSSPAGKDIAATRRAVRGYSASGANRASTSFSLREVSGPSSPRIVIDSQRFFC